MKRNRSKKIIGKWMAVLLCLCLCAGLSACGEGEKVEETTDGNERAASVSNGNLGDDSTALSVGKTTVTYSEYKIYYFLAKNPYGGILNEEVWSYAGASEEGRTLEQDMVEEILRLVIQVKVIDKAAAVQGITLAADEKEEADYNASQFCNSLSDTVKEQYRITEPLVSQIFEENKLANKMYNVITGQVDVNVTAEQSKAARVQLIYLSTSGQDAAAVKQKAEELCERAKRSTGSFYTLAKENTQADEIESIVGKLDSRTKLADTVLGMNKSAVSNVIEEQDGYYIAYCVQAPNQKLNNTYKNQVVEKRQLDAFQEAYKEWAGKYEVKVSKSLLDQEN